MTQYVNPNPPPPPQLSNDDLARLTPDQIVAADAAGQFQVLKTEGRNPTETERLGQRWATPEEAEAARAAEAQADRNLQDQYRRDQRAALQKEDL